MTQGLESITPHLVVRDPAAASAWYQRALGAREASRVPLPDGKVMTIELVFGSSTVMIADEFPDFGILSPLSVGGTSVVLNLEVSDAHAAWARALAEDAEVIHPIADQFWGDRQGQLRDPFGHKWNIAQHLRDVPQAELVEAAAAAFGG
ncbi:MAG TPA: VOC family protein [Gaiellaceae bacterium]|nr:VOC family protein [Gaiellaceae bacterium]